MIKICPFHRYDILNITQWLNEQDFYGWKLQSWGIFFVKFEESDGESWQYQIDLDDRGDGPDEERREKLEAGGWEYVETIFSTTLHVYRSKDKKQIFTRSGEFCEKYCRKERNAAIVSVIVLLVLAAIYLAEPVSKWPFLLVELTRTSKMRIGLYAVLLFLFIGRMVDEFRRGREIRRILKKTCSISVIYGEEEAARRRIRIPFSLIQWILLIGMLLFVIISGNEEGEVRNLSEVDGTVRYVSLEALCGDDFSFSETYFSDSPEINRACCVEWIDGIFAEQFYEVNQYGSWNGKDTERLTGDYWRGVSEKLSDRLFSQIVERYTVYSEYWGYLGSGSLKPTEDYEGEPWKISEIESEAFTKLLIAERTVYGEEERLIFVRKGNDMAYLKYQGAASVELLIEKLTEVI